jgi:hypothetical protein
MYQLQCYYKQNKNVDLSSNCIGDLYENTDVKSWGAAESWNVKEIAIQG